MPLRKRCTSRRPPPPRRQEARRPREAREEERERKGTSSKRNMKTRGKSNPRGNQNPAAHGPEERRNDHEDRSLDGPVSGTVNHSGEDEPAVRRLRRPRTRRTGGRARGWWLGADRRHLRNR